MVLTLSASIHITPSLGETFHKNDRNRKSNIDIENPTLINCLILNKAKKKIIVKENATALHVYLNAIGIKIIKNLLI